MAKKFNEFEKIEESVKFKTNILGDLPWDSEDEELVANNVKLYPKDPITITKVEIESNDTSLDLSVTFSNGDIIIYNCVEKNGKVKQDLWLSGVRNQRSLSLDTFNKHREHGSTYVEAILKAYLEWNTDLKKL